MAIGINGLIVDDGTVNVIDANFYRSFVFVFPIEYDTTYIGISVDDSNLIPEYNEYNNISGVSYLTSVPTIIRKSRFKKFNKQIQRPIVKGEFDILGRQNLGKRNRININNGKLILKR